MTLCCLEGGVGIECVLMTFVLGTAEGGGKAAGGSQLVVHGYGEGSLGLGGAV